MRKISFAFVILFLSLTLFSCKNEEINISFDTNGGTYVNSITYKSGGNLRLPENPVKEGYSFDGWYLDNDHNHIFEDSLLLEKDVILYARWKINKYTIEYNSMGGSAVNPLTQDYNTVVVAPSNPTREGYTFGGWYIDEELTSAFSFSIMPAENIELFAKWIINAYSVSFNSNGGTPISTKTFLYDSELDNLPIPSKLGYVFSNWFLDDEFEQSTNGNNMPAKNIEIYAKWEISTFSIIYNLEDGTNNYNNPNNYNIESENYLLLEPIKEGYVFIGWYDNPQYNGQKITHINIQNLDDITLYAKWRKDSELNDYFAVIHKQDFLDKPRGSTIGFPIEEINNLHVTAKYYYDCIKNIDQTLVEFTCGYFSFTMTEQDGTKVYKSQSIDMNNYGWDYGSSYESYGARSLNYYILLTLTEKNGIEIFEYNYVMNLNYVSPTHTYDELKEEHFWYGEPILKNATLHNGVITSIYQQEPFGKFYYFDLRDYEQSGSYVVLKKDANRTIEYDTLYYVTQKNGLIFTKIFYSNQTGDSNSEIYQVIDEETYNTVFLLDSLYYEPKLHILLIDLLGWEYFGGIVYDGKKEYALQFEDGSVIKQYEIDYQYENIADFNVNFDAYFRFNESTLEWSIDDPKLIVTYKQDIEYKDAMLYFNQILNYLNLDFAKLSSEEMINNAIETQDFLSEMINSIDLLDDTEEKVIEEYSLTIMYFHDKFNEIIVY